MFLVRQGATHKVVLGPAVAVGDGFTPVTTLALTTADEAEVILHDNGTVVDISGYTWAAITTADGYYHLTLQSGISGTVGHVTVVVNDDSLILPLRADFTVLEEAVYDELFAASAPGAATVAALATAQTDLTSLVARLGAFTGTGVNTVLGFLKSLLSKAASTPSDVGGTFDASTDSTEAIRDTAPLGTAMRGTDSAALASVCTEGRLAELDGANLPADVDTLKTRITATIFSGITKLAEWLGAIAGKQAADATALTEIKATGAGSGTYDPTTDANEALRDTAPMGTAMRGTDSAALASVCTEARLSELDAGTGGKAAAEIDLIKAKTDNLPADPADASDIAAAIAALNDLSAAEVNAEVVDALATDTNAELAADPGASPTIVKMLMLLYMALRNKVDIDKTALTKEIHNNAGTVILTKTLSDDDTTYSESKMA